VHRTLGWKFWTVISGGATLPEEVEHFWSALGLVVIQGYGMTETAALVSLVHPFHPVRGSIGKVLPGREVRLSPEGEILVKGETVSGASWAGGEMRPRESEWLATGDLGALDASGSLRFRGRKKDVIVTASGLKIFPEDLEACLLRQPGVRDAAVVEERGALGPHPLAVLVLRGTPDKAVTDPESIAAEAVRAANSELAEFQQIRHWTVWPEPDFPRTSTGKILRREVAATLEIAAAPELAASPAGNAGQTRRGMPTGGGLADILRRITGEDVSALPDSARLSEDVHLDSLARVELQSALETRFGVSIGDRGGYAGDYRGDADFQSVQTLGELRELLKTSGPASESAKKSIQEQHAFVQWPWTRTANAVRTIFLEALAMPLVACLAAPRVLRETSRDRAPAPGAPVLIVANHVTMFDVPILLYGLSRRTRQRVAVAMSGEMLLDWRRARGQGHWLLNLLAPAAYYLVTALFNVFPLPQSGDFRASFAHAAQAMDRGFHVLVFPEGRRTTDGRMHAFQRGSGLLWKELQSGVIPVCLDGLWESQANRAGWFRSGRIRVHIGNAIKPPEEIDPAAATGLLEEAVRGLQG
jgi:long-chain acyl-CoA synthetase